MPALASVCIFFHVCCLLCCQPVSFVIAIPAFTQEIFLVYDFPSFQDQVGLADYVPACIAGDQEGILFSVFAAIKHSHHVPSRAQGLARTRSVRHRGF